jgi:hypothetical protein
MRKLKEGSRVGWNIRSNLGKGLKPENSQSDLLFHTESLDEPMLGDKSVAYNNRFT